MPFLDRDDCSNLLGPIGPRGHELRCEKCKDILIRRYCEKCDEFYFICMCPLEPGSYKDHSKCYKH